MGKPGGARLGPHTFVSLIPPRPLPLPDMSVDCREDAHVDACVGVVEDDDDAEEHESLLSGGTADESEE